MNGWRRTLAGSISAVVLVAACSGSTGAPTPPGSASSAALGAATASSAAASVAPSGAPPSAAVASPASPGAPAPSASGVAFTRVPCNGTVTTPVTSYKVGLTQAYPNGAFDPSKVGGLPPGSVTVQWFHGSKGTWIVWYVGLCNAQAAVCPGNSIKVGANFEDISNSPLAAGGCAGDEKYLAVAPAGLQFCNDGFYFYVTKIPNAKTGTLYASVEHAQPDGTIEGITGGVQTGTSSAAGGTLNLGTLKCKPVG
jgi:hypothetical protein